MNNKDYIDGFTKGFKEGFAEGYEKAKQEERQAHPIVAPQIIYVKDDINTGTIPLNKIKITC